MSKKGGGRKGKRPLFLEAEDGALFLAAAVNWKPFFVCYFGGTSAVMMGFSELLRQRLRGDAPSRQTWSAR